MTLPLHVLSLLGKNERGPNCWNATLHYHDPAHPLKYTDVPVIETWLKENTVSVSDLREGDVLVLGDVEHTAVYVGQDEFGNALFFHKVGWNYRIGWEVCNVEQMFDTVRYSDLHASDIRRKVA